MEVHSPNGELRWLKNPWSVLAFPSAYQSTGSAGKPRNNQRVAAAYLQTHELQDLVEKIAKIKSAAAGIDLKFKLQIEIGGSQLSDDAIARLNQLLKESSENLDLK